MDRLVSLFGWGHFLCSKVAVGAAGYIPVQVGFQAVLPDHKVLLAELCSVKAQARFCIQTRPLTVLCNQTRMQHAHCRWESSQARLHNPINFFYYIVFFCWEKSLARLFGWKGSLALFHIFVGLETAQCLDKITVWSSSVWWAEVILCNWAESLARLPAGPCCERGIYTRICGWVMLWAVFWGCSETLFSLPAYRRPEAT